MQECRIWPVIFAVGFILSATGYADTCSPGRGGKRRTVLRRLTPLVFKQHVPNIGENTIRASGLAEGKIVKDDARFKDLVPNYSQDVLFKDEEGTGEDRFMTQRCKEKLNTLAISVMNQWPGVKIRVTEGWGNDKHHATNSLHYEGRAVDITTSDRDRSKYGMLARLAVEAGFDWVYYESRAHIHCSVKSESSRAAKSGGCFTGSSTVTTKKGPTRMRDLRKGDEVLTANGSGQLVYSEVIMFLDNDLESSRLFHVIETEDGAKITATPSHLIYISKEDKTKIGIAKAVPTFAANVEVGDFVYVAMTRNSSQCGRGCPVDGVTLQRITKITARHQNGVFAPLTRQGNIIVDNVLASCYAVIDSQKIAHWAFAPVRIYTSVVEFLRGLSLRFRTVFSNRVEVRSMPTAQVKEPSQGIHWYARTLYFIAQHILPSNFLYGQQ